MRDLQEDTEINGVMMEAGTSVLVSILGCHRNPAVWEDPEEFRPERFETESDHDPFAFIIYSAGPRNCIGQKYADMQSRVCCVRQCVPSTRLVTHIFPPISTAPLGETAGLLRILYRRRHHECDTLSKAYSSSREWNSSARHPPRNVATSHP